MCSCIAVLCAGTSLPPRARARINISTDIFPDTSPPRSPTCLSTPPKDMPQLSTSATSTQRKRAAASMEGAVTMRCCLIPNIPANEDAGAQLSDGDRQKVRMREREQNGAVWCVRGSAARASRGWLSPSQPQGVRAFECT
jgi:hypothetical protein